jgi:hypothetical protein
MAAFFRNTLYILTAYIVLTLITYEHLFCNKIFFSSETTFQCFVQHLEMLRCENNCQATVII